MDTYPQSTPLPLSSLSLLGVEAEVCIRRLATAYRR